MDTVEIVVLVVAVVFALTAIWGSAESCPKCKKWWARQLTDRREIDRDETYRTVTRYDIHRNSKGEEIGKTEREEQIRVTVVTYDEYYSCKSCGNEWSQSTVREF